MSTKGSLAGLNTFNGLNIKYEIAYGDNRLKKKCLDEAISRIPASSRVLDVGCGTGVPVSAMLAEAGHHVIGLDISPEMIKLAESRVVQGNFIESDMLDYEIEDKFAAVFIIFSHLQLSYANFHFAALKYAGALQPGGILVIGQMPSDSYVKGGETEAYVEEYPAPFMGEMLPTLMLSIEGQRNFLLSMGLEIVRELEGTFQPRYEECKYEPEKQQYIIARRSSTPLSSPEPLPKESK